MTAALDALVSGEADAAIVDAISLALYPKTDQFANAGAPLVSDPYVVVVASMRPTCSKTTVLARAGERWYPGRVAQTMVAAARDTMIHFDIFHPLPGMFSGFLADSILKRAQAG